MKSVFKGIIGSDNLLIYRQSSYDKYHVTFLYIFITFPEYFLQVQCIYDTCVTFAKYVKLYSNGDTLIHNTVRYGLNVHEKIINLTANIY